MQKRVTLAQIAAKAHVSSSTASFVLSRRQGVHVSASTKQRVIDVASSLGYIPRRASSPTVANVLPEIGLLSDTVASDVFSGGLITGCNLASADRGRGLLIAETNGIPVLEATALERFLELGIAHFVVASTGAWRRSLPTTLVERQVVLLNCVDPTSNVPAVLPDDRAAGAAAAQALLDVGHRDRIFLVGSVPPSSLSGHARSEGINEALERQSLKLGGNVDCAWLPEAARQAALPLLLAALGSRPTAVIAVNDRVALGVYQAASELGIAIPEALSVVSFDDSNLAGWMRPGLTSMKLPYVEMGRLAVDLLFTARPQRRLYVPMTMTQRNSIAPPSCGPLAERPDLLDLHEGSPTPRLRDRALLNGTPQPLRDAAAGVSGSSRLAHSPDIGPTAERNGRRSNRSENRDNTLDPPTELDAFPNIGHPAIRALRGAGYTSLHSLAGTHAPRRAIRLEGHRAEGSRDHQPGPSAARSGPQLTRSVSEWRAVSS
jgi:LacI family transcriptional regulator